MIMNRQRHDNTILYINDQPIEKTSKCKYLGSIFSDKWDSSGEVKIRMAMAKSPLLDLISISCSRRCLCLRLCNQILHVAISIYRAETSSLKVGSLRIKAFEMWMLKRFLRIF